MKPLVLIYADGSYEEVDAADLARRMDPRALYSKDQPRVPAGNPDGGQWTDGPGAPIAPGDETADPASERLTSAIFGDTYERTEDGSIVLSKWWLRIVPKATIDAKRAAIRERLAAQGLSRTDWGVQQTDIRGRAVPEDQQADSERVGMDTLARGIETDWAASSVDGQRAVRLQRSAQDVFGLGEGTVQHLRKQIEAASAPDAYRPTRIERAYVRAEYEATQAWLKAHGITGSVTLYRGQSGSKTKLEDGEHDVVLQPSSSWTLDKAVAEEMYKLQPYEAGQGRAPYLMTARVPISRIQSLPITGRGVLPEAEVLVVGGPARVRTRRLPQPAALAPPKAARAKEVVYIDADPVDADWLKRGGPRALYSPEQPRVPAGSPNGGEWTAADSGLPTPESDVQRANLDRVAFHDSYSQTGAGAEVRTRRLLDRMGELVPPDHPVWHELGIPPGQQNGMLISVIDHAREAWGVTANDSDTSIRMQRLTKELFAPEGETSHFNEAQLTDPPIFRELFAHNAALARAFLRAEYEVTQRWLADHGITGEVTLYRGQKGVVTHPPQGDQTVTMQPASSWTTDLNIAEKEFAYQVGLNQPYTLATRVPVSRILSLYPTGRGTHREREIIIAGGPIRAQVSYVPVSQVRDYAAARALYSKDQPRVPAGSPEGGQWADGGAIRPGQSPEADDMGRVLTGALLREARDSEALGDRLHDFGEITGEERSHLSYRAAVALADRVVQSRRLTDADWEALRSVYYDDPANDPEQQQRLARLQVEAIQERWRDTSGDGDFEAAKNQLAVKREFGLDDAPMSHLGSEDDYHQFHGDRMQDDGGPLNRAIAREEYAATQDWLKAQGVTGYVTVYRGLLGQTSRPPDGEQDVTLQPASSWSVDRKVAERFANNWGDGELTTGHPGMPMRPYIVTAQVPVSRIFSVGATGRAAINEGEVIVLGGKARVLVTPWRHTPKGWGGQ